jgi:SAM-dependent methyltransferase
MGWPKADPFFISRSSIFGIMASPNSSAPTDVQQSWQANAHLWIEAIENSELESRVLATNAAVVEAVLALGPITVLDVGCGEGWLCRCLAQHGIEVTGIDATPALVSHAQKRGAGNFQVVSFEGVVAGHWQPAIVYDVAVINFALYGEALTHALLKTLSGFAKHLVLQTVHPHAALRPGEAYQSGWQPEDWAGLKRPFTHPFQWYSRTVSAWVNTCVSAGFSIQQLSEPLHPQTGKPLSLVITAASSLGEKTK